MAPLSRGRRRTLRAIVAAIRPRGHGFDQPIDDDVLRAVEAFLPFLPPLLRRGFPLGLDLIELGPPLFIRRWSRFSTLPLPEAQRYLDRFHAAGGLRGALLLGLRTLVFLAFYQHPQVLAALDIDWAGRAEVLVRRRGELLGEHTA
jgi:hypothetical protein